MTHAEISDHLGALRDAFIESHQSFGTEYVWDESIESLATMDRAITEMWGGESPAMIDPMVEIWGGYLAKVIEAHLPGEWVHDEEEGLRYLAQGEQTPQFNPFVWIRKRFVDGEGDSVAFKFKAVQQICAGEIDLEK